MVECYSAFLSSRTILYYQDCLFILYLVEQSFNAVTMQFLSKQSVREAATISDGQNTILKIVLLF